MWCLDKLWFYSETKLYDNQFGYCKFTETWADSKVVLRSGSEWLGVYNEDSRIDCDLGEKRVLQKMSYKVQFLGYINTMHLFRNLHVRKLWRTN